MGPSKPVTYVTVCALGGDSAFCSLRRCREGKAVEAAPKAQIESASQMPEKPIHVPRAGAAISVAIVCSLSLPKELVIRKLIECSVYSNNERKR